MIPILNNNNDQFKRDAFSNLTYSQKKTTLLEFCRVGENKRFHRQISVRYKCHSGVKQVGSWMLQHNNLTKALHRVLCGGNKWRFREWTMTSVHVKKDNWRWAVANGEFVPTKEGEDDVVLLSVSVWWWAIQLFVIVCLFTLFTAEQTFALHL